MLNQTASKFDNKIARVNGGENRKRPFFIHLLLIIT